MLSFESSDPVSFFIQFLAVMMAGACVGSFATAIIDREKKGQSWIKDSNGSASRSACPHCHHILGFWDLIPLLSWLALRGRCRYCTAPVARFYPLVEISCIILAVLTWLILGWECSVLIILAGLGFWFSSVFLVFSNHRPSVSLIISSFLCLFILLFYVLFAFVS